MDSPYTRMPWRKSGGSGGLRDLRYPRDNKSLRSGQTRVFMPLRVVCFRAEESIRALRFGGVVMVEA